MKINSKYIKYLMFAMYIFIFICIFLIVTTLIKNHIKWTDDTLIYHAFGEINGSTYTNSLEAFENSYKNGIRTFEVDLHLTSDNKVVLAHDFDKPITPTEEEFLNTPILGKYTPMSFKDLLELMKIYPDIYIITDSKYNDKDNITLEFSGMLKVSKETDSINELDRLIIQLYNEEMYDYVTNIYPFNSFIFTIYMRWCPDAADFENTCLWCNSHNIKSITMPKHYFNLELQKIAQKYNINIYVHTENDVNAAKFFVLNGVKGIYTDNISRKDILSFLDIKL